MDAQSIVIDEVSYPIVRVKFKKFLDLEKIRMDIRALSMYVDEVSNKICDYVTLASSCPRESLDTLSWEEIAKAFVTSMNINVLPFTLPFMMPRKEKFEPDPWEYPDRIWYIYVHLIAKEYGWSLDHISELEVDDALRIIQEILIAKQLEREWQWDLSEKSIGWDEVTKKSKYNPLPRPSWMQAPLPEPKKIKILKAHMPVGNVIRPDGSHVEYS